jgi:hypothetical protein
VYTAVSANLLPSPTVTAGPLNPAIGIRQFTPRSANLGTVTSSAGGAIANATLTIVDGGMAMVSGAQSPVVQLYGPQQLALVTTAVSFTTTLGGAVDTSWIQPI